ncbi:MAG: glycoside hydrolase family 15 protein, partial [Acidimicrobiales bacterium]
VFRAEGGPVPVTVRVAPRFDYGGVAPWLRAHDGGRFSAVGGSEGLVIWSDVDLRIDEHQDLVCQLTLQPGETRRLSIRFCEPELLDADPPADGVDGAMVDARLLETVAWWRSWCGRQGGSGRRDPAVLRSALVLKSLVTANTGAIVAAPTTSLPEEIGGERNWDYRYSWIRDSWLTVRSLADLGFEAETDGFRRFVERSAAGSANEVHLLYGVDGSHRAPEVVLEELEGYRGSAPVRIGNAASTQLQLDMYGYLVELAWQWTQRGQAPDHAYAGFIAEIVALVCDLWARPDHGIWEVRNEPQHFVHSKALCWTAVDRGVRLADAGALRNGGPIDRDRWCQVREDIRASIFGQGVSARRGNFVQAYGSEELDASLLLLPAAGFVAVDDPHMVATVDAIIEELDQDGLIRRYRTPDGLRGGEGQFVACTFWLVECLAGQGRHAEARAYFDRVCVAGNDLGLFAEEFNPRTGELLGNFPQALSHLAHIGAALVLAKSDHAQA